MRLAVALDLAACGRNLHTEPLHEHCLTELHRGAHVALIAIEPGSRGLRWHGWLLGPGYPPLLELEPKSDRIQTALADAKQNLHTALTVSQLAEVAHLSPRQFSAETGQSPAKAKWRVRRRPTGWPPGSSRSPPGWADDENWILTCLVSRGWARQRKTRTSRRRQGGTTSLASLAL
jgi:hypothetical protein